MFYNYLTIHNEYEWNDYVERSIAYENYHTWYYHSLNREGQALLFVFEEDESFIALPLIKRSVAGTSHYDLTTVYGYVGPISNKDLAQVSLVTYQHFKAAFITFMQKENCICVFSRLHPFLNQQCLLENFGGIKENGSTVYIDLTTSIDEQKSKYEKRLSRQIKQLRQAGYFIKEADTQEEIRDFTEMYWKNMDRLNASPNYYFDEIYFTNLLNTTKLESKLILIYNGTELICGAIIMLSSDIIRNHLSATAADYLKESPSKLLTDEISMIGRRLGKKIFHLGGGVGGKEDNLFKFKSYFSDLKIKDRVWCYIENTSVYDELVSQRINDSVAPPNYFPLYRNSLKKEFDQSQYRHQ